MTHPPEWMVCGMNSASEKDARTVQLRKYEPTRGPGYWETLQRLFRNHPIQFPLIVFSVGAISFVLQQLAGIWSVWFTSIAILMIVFGVLVLPVGLIVSARRRRTVVLRCPNCGTVSTEAKRPFRVDYPPGVDYAYVTCSRCGMDFTVDKFARLA